MSLSLVRTRFSAIAAKIETTPGTDSIAGSPVAGDFILGSAQARFGPNVVTDPSFSGALDELPGIVGSLSPTIEIMVPMRGSGTAGKGELRRGEQKSLQTDRVVLRPGPADEVSIVQDIYRAFVEQGHNEAAIARRLNEDGIATDLGRPWTRGTVHQVLTNEKYIGGNVYNRLSFKLKQRRVANPPERWVRKPGAFEAIVPTEVFFTAQGIVRARARRHSDDELLSRLRELHQARGYLSGILIDETEGMASSTIYAHRFGSLVRAYSLVGFTPDRDYRYLEINRFLRRLHPEIVQRTEAAMMSLGARIERDGATDLLRVNGEFTVSLILARCHEGPSGRRRWKLRLDTGLCPDITVAVRLNGENDGPLDYYLLPWMDLAGSHLSLGEANGVHLDGYRFDTLDPLYRMAEHLPIRRAA